MKLIKVLIIIFSISIAQAGTMNKEAAFNSVAQHQKSAEALIKILAEKNLSDEECDVQY